MSELDSSPEPGTRLRGKLLAEASSSAGLDDSSPESHSRNLRGGLVANAAKVSGAAALGEHVDTSGSFGPEPSQTEEQRLHGKFVERLQMREPMEYLQSLTALKGDYSWSELLSGETALSSGGVRIHDKRPIHAAGESLDKSVFYIGGVLKGPDYEALAREHPTQHYKFYHSFADEERGEAYVTELVKRAAQEGLSLKLKAFDHAYDGINVYTHHFQRMAALIRELYPEYNEAFYGTEHFLQGPIDDVDPQHIGWAQEPVPRASEGSHSNRMRLLGQQLDSGGLTEDAYRAGCERAGVRPAQPWRLDQEYEQKLRDKYAREAETR